MPVLGYLEKLHIALAIWEATAYSDALSLLASVLPDNANFDINDVASWERRLGLAPSGASTSDRMLAIARKMNFPGNIRARQNYLYLQDQLNAAGFDVTVFENIFADGLGGFITKTVSEITGGTGGAAIEYGDSEYGAFEYGGESFGEIVVNNIDASIDAAFDIGSNLRSTFFICGTTLGTMASVPAIRKDEFRELILKIKPVQTVGFLLVNYV